MTVPVAPKRINIQLKLLDIEGNPLAAMPCELAYGLGAQQQVLDLVTDSSAMLKFWVPAGQPANLTFFSGEELVTMELEIANFGAADSVAGARARLNNLGYMALGGGEQLDAAVDDKLTRALDRFRFANHIVDGDQLPVGPMAAPFDQKTAARLSDAHDGNGPLLTQP